MTLPSVFNPTTTATCLDRLEKLNVDTHPQWGKMNAAQMLAHLNVAYDITYEKTKIESNFFMKLMLKLFVKNMVVGEKAYPKNSRTAPHFVVANERDFQKEKNLLIENIKTTEAKGTAFFEGKENISFGVMSSNEWSNLFYKHIDHHFSQFGI